MIRTLLVLGRVSNLPTVWTNCIAGWVLVGALFNSAGNFALSIQGLVYLLVGTSFLYVGGMALNDVCDAAWDREHAGDRPIPSGKISREWAGLVAGGAIVAGVMTMLTVKMAAWPWVGGLVLAIALYDLVHKRWSGAVLIMGACRFLLYLLAGYTALRGEDVWAMPGRLWMAAAGIFFYVVGITVAARGESTGGRVRGWAWLLLAGPLLGWVAGGADLVGTVFAALFVAWLWRCAIHLRGDDPARVGRFVSGLLAGLVLADAMMASMSDVRAAIFCLAFFPLTLFLQRYVPAT